MKIKNILTAVLFLVVMILPMFVGVGRVEAGVIEIPLFWDNPHHMTISNPNLNHFQTNIQKFNLLKTFDLIKDGKNIDDTKTIVLNMGDTFIATSSPSYTGSFAFMASERLSDNTFADATGFGSVGNNIEVNPSGNNKISLKFNNPVDMTNFYINTPRLYENNPEKEILYCVNNTCEARNPGTTTISVGYSRGARTNTDIFFETCGIFSADSPYFATKYKIKGNCLKGLHPESDINKTLYNPLNDKFTNAKYIKSVGSSVLYGLYDLDAKKFSSDGARSSYWSVEMSVGDKQSHVPKHPYSSEYQNYHDMNRYPEPSYIFNNSHYIGDVNGYVYKESANDFEVRKTFTITVPGTPNTPQVSTCTGATGITKDSATVNWSYTDVDNDPQTQYQVQLSTKSFIDATFTNADIVFASSSVSANTNHTFTGLTPNTTYYSRIRTYNATNGWSTTFSPCAFGFTTSPDDVPPGLPICSCNGTRTFTCTTNGVATTTTPASTQCDFESSCEKTVSGNQASFTYSPLGTNIGNVTYTHPGVIETKTGPNYIYTYSTTTIPGTTQSLRVLLTDSYDTSTSSAICSVDNTIIPITTTPTINIIKSPRISLNKNSKCKLDWNIENMPENTTCTLSGFSTGASLSLPSSFDPNLTTSIKSWTSPPLQQNTKYTISCSRPELTTTISKSAICRVNPSIGEI